MVYDYIIQNYRKGEPIFLSELPGESKDYLRQEMKKLTDDMVKEQKAKRKNLRKVLVDTRYGNGATRKDEVKKWKAHFKEYAAIEGKAAYEDEKILAAAQHYGIEIKKPKK